MRIACAAALLLLSGCATTLYEPRVVARSELTLRYRGGFELWAEGRRVSRGLTYGGLEDYVRCVPAAQPLARAAQRDGRMAVASIVLGAGLGAGSLIGLTGLALDGGKVDAHFWPFAVPGVAMAITGTVFAGLSRLYRNRANGQAIDAMNHYNDAVGSLGASCADLRYPAPAGPAPAPEPPTAPEEAPLPVPAPAP